MKTPKDRLMEYLNAKRLSLSVFAEKVGVNKAVLSRISEATNPKTLQRIENASDLNADWLIRGEEPMCIDRNNIKSPEQSTAKLVGGVFPATHGDDEIVMVEYVSGIATASFVEYGGDGNPERETIAVVRRQGEVLDKSYKVFEVMGESMAPTLSNRAKILTREVKESKWASAEGVVVVVFADEVVVKRIWKNTLVNDNYLLLSSDNVKYGEMRVQLADIRRIFKAVRIIEADIV